MTADQSAYASQTQEERRKTDFFTNAAVVPMFVQAMVNLP
jgi:hypothetical protein